MTSPYFNAASISALVSAVASLIGGVGAWLLGHAPDWEDVRPLALVGLTAAIAAACNVTGTLDLPAAVHAWSSRLEVAILALHVASWFAYFLHWGTPQQRRRRWIVYGPLTAAAAATLVPGVVFTDATALRPVPWLGVVYHDPAVAPAGFVVLGLIVGYGAVGVGWIASLRGRGLPYRRSFITATALILAMGVHDALVAGGFPFPVPTPYLVDFGLYLPAVTVAVVTMRRIVETAVDLRRLRTGLEVLVVERTAALERSQTALFASERLAALGQFAGGFAREVEHPVKVVEANLEALGRELRDDPRDRIWARLGDARGAVEQIGTLARQLLVAGRAAAAPPGPAIDVRVGRAVESALARARARGVPGVSLNAAVTPGLTVSAHEDEVVEVLGTLVLDAMGRIAPGQVGAVTVRAEAAGDRVRISVEDDGARLSDDALLHAFEPFHETERVRGAGLRRAVARGLVEGMGGTVRIERAGERGTHAVVDLVRGAPDASPADLPVARVAAPRRARVLVADGDPSLVHAVVAEVGKEHEVEAVAGIPAALAALSERSFDVVLCDAALPGGGGERLWEELLLRSPALLGRVAFLVGGREPPAVRAFLDRQPQPVLRKPFGLPEVQVLLDWLGLNASGPPGRAPSLTPVGRIREA